MVHTAIVDSIDRVVCILRGIGAFFSTTVGVFPGCEVYMECLSFGMDVSDADFLPGRSIAGHTALGGDQTEPHVLLHHPVQRDGSLRHTSIVIADLAGHANLRIGADCWRVVLFTEQG